MYASSREIELQARKDAENKRDGVKKYVNLALLKKRKALRRKAAPAKP